ncbi:hypothetical protein BGX31_004475 [Mortierella sp. GBA43]|nr:hypothetical protein BGX31_004475 [Mortierella sp. GBA43]
MTATAVAQATTVVVTEAVAEPPVEMAQEMVASAPAENSDDASAAVQTIVSPSVVQTTVAEPCSGILIRPTKSALKRQRTRTQVFDELRAFTHTPHYEALTRSLAVAFEGTTLNHTDGSQSEPISPVSSNTGPSLLIPIFPAPTKYHFRSGDRRRASFPKSASHPNRLNLNGNVNMNVNLRLNCCDNVVPGRSSSVGSVSSKQLRFSLEVQELVFMPTSPPFRISRAKPTRAHSDPAIQSTGYSSFIAPSHAHAGLHPHMQHHAGSLIATAAGSTDDSTTTFIKVQAHDSRGGKNSSAKLYLQHDDDDDFLDDFNDDYLFEDCQNYDDDEDEEDDEFNGVGTGSHRHRFSTKNAIVARRAQEDEQRKAAPGMLWQVYTAVTGVKELIAWYGSMVYHSSSL